MSAVSPGRYWNPNLAPLYSEAARVPLVGFYSSTQITHPCLPPHPLRRDGANFVSLIPQVPLNDHLKANRFQSIAAPTQHSKLPTLPDYVNSPSKKRKRDTCATKKTDLPPGSFYRARRIRLWPTHKQRILIWRWFGAKRCFNNKTVEIIRDCMDNNQRVPSKLELRDMVKPLVRQAAPWIDQGLENRSIPLQVCVNGSFAAYQAYHSNMAKKEKNPHHRFTLHFQNLNRVDLTPTEVIQFDPSTSKYQGTLHSFVPVPSRRQSPTSKRADIGVKFGGGLGVVRATDTVAVVQELLDEGMPKFAPVILWDKRMRAFYLIHKRVVQRPQDTKPPEKREVMAFDPNARNFATFYRPDGVHGELLRGAEHHMHRMCRHSDHLRSKMDRSETEHQKKVLRTRMLRTNARISNFMRNAHYETINYCFSLADFMLVPVFNTDRMVRRASRFFGSETARQLYTWSHYKFRQRMWSKVEVTPDKQMAFTSEPGTTKTCDKCGFFNTNVGGSRIFSCPSCGHRSGRDFHAARGNLLAALGVAHM